MSQKSEQIEQEIQIQIDKLKAEGINPSMIYLSKGRFKIMNQAYTCS